MDKAEAELLKLGIMDQRADWVHETFITDDTETLAAAADDRLIARTTELVKEGKRFEALALPAESEAEVSAAEAQPARARAPRREAARRTDASCLVAEWQLRQGKVLPG